MMIGRPVGPFGTLTMMRAVYVGLVPFSVSTTCWLSGISPPGVWAGSGQLVQIPKFPWLSFWARAFCTRNWAEPVWVLYVVLRRLVIVGRSILATSAFTSVVSR